MIGAAGFGGWILPGIGGPPARASADGGSPDHGTQRIATASIGHA